MARKKRGKAVPPPPPRSSSTAAGSGGAGEGDAGSVLSSDAAKVRSVNDGSSQVNAKVRVECDRALKTSQRGNHNKALRMIKELSQRFESCAVVFRTQGTICVRAASVIDDPNTKQKHLKNAVEAARRAVELSPKSIGFAQYYVSLLYDVASESEDYDQILQECEKALGIEDPTDPAEDYCLEESEEKFLIAEGKISHVRSELRLLIQKANIASISSWIKSLNNGEEKFKLILLRRASEDPMKLKMVQTQRPDESKKFIKTPEERRKEIEAKVAAARLLQSPKQSGMPQSQSGGQKLSKMPDSASTNVQKVGERRKRGNIRKSGSSMERRDLVQSYWNGMSDDMKKSLLKINISDLKTHFASSKDGFEYEILSEALSYAEVNKSWKFWVCCNCKANFADQDNHMLHVKQQHVSSLSSELQSVLPQSVSDEWVEMILSSSWKPLDVSNAFENTDNQSGWKGREVDGPERANLLEKIHSLFKALIHRKCLAESHLSNVLQFTMNELQGLSSDLQPLRSDIDRSPECICFLGKSQLKTVLGFLQNISSCSLGGSPKKSARVLDDLNKNHLGIVVKENIALSEDSAALLLHGCFLSEEPTTAPATAAEIKHSIDLGGLLSWIYAGPSVMEQHATWMRSREEKSHRGMEILQLLDKKFHCLQDLWERKRNKIGYLEALQILKDLCVEESKRRGDGLDVQSHVLLLKKRQEMILQEEKDSGTMSHKFESDAISNVIKETESLSAAVSHDLESGLDDDSRTNDYINQMNTTTELIIRRGLDELYIELGEIDAKIMKILSGVRQMEMNLESVSIHDYQIMILCLVKSFLQAYLEELAEKDATEKSDAVREALLAELELDSKKGLSGKIKDKKKSKDYRRAKGTKIYSAQEQRNREDEVADQLSTLAISKHEDSLVDAGKSEDDLTQKGEEFRHKSELEADERKLEEMLEYPKKFENEAKQKLLTEVHPQSLSTALQKLPEELPKSHSHENGGKILRKSQVEDDKEEKFQSDFGKVVPQSIGTYEAHKKMPQASCALPEKASHVVDSRISPKDGKNGDESQVGIFGTGLKNETGEYNCFLNVIIQSLWHIRCFRDVFSSESLLRHVHIGDPCVVCALHDIFNSLSMASMDRRREAVDPTSLRIALSKLCPDSNFFQEGQMNDASEVLGVIFDCLHRSYTPQLGVSDTKLKEMNDIMGSWDCSSNDCIAHSIFGMNIFEYMVCQSCQLESRRMKYTLFFHNINASALRTMKMMYGDKPFDELMNLVEMNHQVACDPESGGCGKHNYIHHSLSTRPLVFTSVLGWQNANETSEDIKATLAALGVEVDIAVLYQGLDHRNTYFLASVVCYCRQHYICFAKNHGQWLMYDDETVKAVGNWEEVLSMCERGRLQPQVLFFESVN